MRPIQKIIIYILLICPFAGISQDPAGFLFRQQGALYNPALAGGSGSQSISQRVWYSTAIVDQHPSESWNGQLDNTGEHLPQGAFTWLAKVEFVNGDSRVYKGSVTLLR